MWATSPKPLTLGSVNYIIERSDETVSVLWYLIIVHSLD